MTEFPTLITTDADASPPNADESYETISDYEWVIRRFTAPEWTVESAEFEDNDHSGARCTVLSASLSHESGSHVQVLPFDPWDHHAGRPLYRRHRVRLRDAEADENHYVTVDTDVAPEFDPNLIGELSESDSGSHPFQNAADFCTFNSQKQVHSVDEKVEEIDSDKGRGYNIETIDHAILAVFAATQRVSREVQKQTGLDAFAVSG